MVVIILSVQFEDFFLVDGDERFPINDMSFSVLPLYATWCLHDNTNFQVSGIFHFSDFLTEKKGEDESTEKYL